MSAYDQAVLRVMRRHDTVPQRDPYHCLRAPLGVGHRVREDNPMATGRCDFCRTFVAWAPRRGGWRAATPTYAAHRGLFGARRHHVDALYLSAQAGRG